MASIVSSTSGCAAFTAAAACESRLRSDGSDAATSATPITETSSIGNSDARSPAASIAGPPTPSTEVTGSFLASASILSARNARAPIASPEGSPANTHTESRRQQKLCPPKPAPKPSRRSARPGAPSAAPRRDAMRFQVFLFTRFRISRA